jgi:hypothetical protein
MSGKVSGSTTLAYRISNHTCVSRRKEGRRFTKKELEGK